MYDAIKEYGKIDVIKMTDKEIAEELITHTPNQANEVYERRIREAKTTSAEVLLPYLPLAAARMSSEQRQELLRPSYPKCDRGHSSL